jgi:membrane-associated phospholipid phosphatase
MSDYTRGLPRLNVTLWAGFAAALVVLMILLQPYDARVNAALSELRLPGDVRRELGTLQQFGQGACVLIVAAVVMLLDRSRRHRLFDYALALAMLGAIVTAMKGLVGRPRPLLGDPNIILGPFGTYPIERDGHVFLAHAWDLTKPISSDLWSMPSSHTAFGVAMAVFLTSLYPRLVWLVAPLAGLVGFGRLVFDAHWLTDVLAGAAVGWLVTYPVMRRSWGVRLVRWALRLDRTPQNTAGMFVGDADEHAGTPAGSPIERAGS